MPCWRGVVVCAALAAGCGSEPATPAPVANQPPVALEDVVTALEDTPLAIGVLELLANDVDPEGQALGLVTVAPITDMGGTATLHAGVVTYAPPPTYSGVDEFAYTLSDGRTTGSGRVLVTVLAVPDPPVAGPDVATTAEDTPLGIFASALLQNDTDEEGDTLIVTSVSAVSAQGGTATLVSGVITYTPAADYAGTDTLTYTVEDSAQLAAVGSLTVTVTPVNDAPVALGDVKATSEDTALTFAVADLLANDSDDTGPLALSAASAVSTHGGLVNMSGASLTYTPPANYNGSDDFTYTVRDPEGLTSIATVVVSVAAVNDAPSAGADVASTLEDTSLLLSVAALIANDTDVDEATPGTLTAVSSASAQGGTVTLSGPSITYSPAPNYAGADSFTYTLRDAGGLTSVGTVTVSVGAVNDAPGFTAGGDVAVLEDAGPHSLIGWATGMNAGPSNEAAQALAFSVTGNTQPGLFASGPAVDAEGTLRFTPAAEANGAALITLRLTDSGGTASGGLDASPTQSFTITVAAVNDAPSFASAGDVGANEDAGPQSFAGWASALAPGPSDEASQEVHFAITANDNPGLFATAPSVADDGTLAFSAAPDAFGLAHLAVVLRDDGGSANGGSDTSVSRALTITIGAVNDPPSFLGGGNLVAREDAGARVFPGWASSIGVGPSNEAAQGRAFVVTANSAPSLFASAPALDSAGTLTLTPAANQSGAATLTVELRDDGGVTGGGDDTSASVTFTVTVTPVNDPPTFTPGSDPTVGEDAGAVSVAWATNILPGPPDEAAQSVAFFVTANDDPQLFAVAPTITPSGALSFTPAPNAWGIAHLQVVLHDDGGALEGGVDTTVATTLTLTVTTSNDAPQAGDDALAAAQNSTSELGAGQLLANDTDVDGPSLTLGSVQDPSDQGATVTLLADGVRYTPPLGFSGLDTFTYTLADGAGGFDTATVTVDVQPDLTPPLFLAAASRPLHGDLLTAAESFGPSGALSPARFVFADANMDEAAASVTVTFLGAPLAPGVDYQVVRLVNELRVEFLAPLSSLGALAQGGDLLRFDVSNIRDLAGNVAPNVSIEVLYDERPPTITWLETHALRSRRALVAFDETMDGASLAAFSFRDALGRSVLVEPDQGPSYRGSGWLDMLHPRDRHFFVPRDLLLPGQTYAIDYRSFTDPAGNECSGACRAELTVEDPPLPRRPELLRVELLAPGTSTVLSSVPRSSILADALLLPAEVAGQSIDLRFVFDGTLTSAGTAGLLEPIGFSLESETVATLESAGVPNDALRLSPASARPGFVWSADQPWRVRLELIASGESRAVGLELVLYVRRGSSDVIAPQLVAVGGGRASGATPLVRPSEAVVLGFSEPLEPASVTPARFVVSGPSGLAAVRVELLAWAGAAVTLRAADAAGEPVPWEPGTYLVTASDLADLATPSNTLAPSSVSFVVSGETPAAPTLLDTSPNATVVGVDESGLALFVAFSDAVARTSFVDTGDPAVQPRGYRVEEVNSGFPIPLKGFVLAPRAMQNDADGAVVQLDSTYVRLLPATEYRLTLLPGTTSADGVPLAPSSSPVIRVTTANAGAALHVLSLAETTLGVLDAIPPGLPTARGRLLESTFVSGGALRDPDPAQGWAMVVSNGAVGFRTEGYAFTPYLELNLEAARTNALIDQGIAPLLFVIFQDGSGNQTSLVTRLHRPAVSTLVALVPTVTALGDGRFAFSGSSAALSDVAQLDRPVVMVAELDPDADDFVALVHLGRAQVTRDGSGLTYDYAMPAGSALPPLVGTHEYRALVLFEAPAVVGQARDDLTRALSAMSAAFAP